MNHAPSPIIGLLALATAALATPVFAQQADSNENEPLPIKYPRPGFTGTPLEYKSPNLEPQSLRRRPPFLAPKGASNVALGKPVSSSSEEPMIGSLPMIVDGEKGYGEENLVDLDPGKQWVQIDLGSLHEVYAIVVWHYHAADRVYFDVIAQTATDAAFTQGVTTHFNNDHDNSSGMGVGSDPEYIDDFQGRLIDTDGAKAQYVRLYSNGSTASDFNQYLEIEVYGKPAAAGGSSSLSFETGGVEDGGYTIKDDERKKVMAALPEKARVEPRKPRRLLIFDLNVIYGGHKPARAMANLAFQEMAKKTGAFEVVFTRDPKAFEKENLSQFDAVFFNSTVGNQFSDPQLRQNLMDFIYAGGGLMGVHGTTVAFFRWDKDNRGDDWPVWGRIIGSRGAGHRANQEQLVLKVDSPDHPLLDTFPPLGFACTDEFYRPRDPFTRDRSRVLISIDNQRTDLSGKPHEREDRDYPAAWVHNFGRGRVFYSTIGHNAFQFWDPSMLKFYLDAAQFVLGDLDAPTTPSGRVTPAILAQEKLGWRFGTAAYTYKNNTIFEAIDKASESGFAYIGGLTFMNTSKEIEKKFDYELTEEEINALRLKLDDANIRMLTCFFARKMFPTDEAGLRRSFDFARKLGIETIVGEPPVEALDTIESLCNEYDINLAIHNHDKKASPDYWSPEAVMKVVSKHGPRIGVCADTGYYMRAGIDPIKAVSTIGDRLMVVQLHDANNLSDKGHDVPWGTGVGKVKEFLQEVHKHGLQPIIELEYSREWGESDPKILQSMKYFDEVVLEIANTATDS